MARQRRDTSWRPHLRCIVVGFLLVSYLMASIGFPALAPTDIGRSFSCRDRPCGCMTSEQCRHCCCSANALDVKAPAPVAPCTATRGCPLCAVGGEGAVPSPSDGEPCCGSCHEVTPAACCHAAQKPHPDAQSSGVRWVIGVSALACKGQSLLWLGTSVSLSPAMPVEGNAPPSPCGWLVWHDEQTQTVARIPPKPPPRHKSG